MKRVVYSILCSGLALALAACGGPDSVDEELLPTRVPTLAAEAFDLPPATATSVPAVPTATPEAVAPSAEITATEELTASEELTATEEVTSTEEVTTEIAAAEELTSTEELTATEELTSTEELTATEELTTTEEVTATEDLTETEGLSVADEITATREITDSEELTSSGEIAAGDEVTGTEETDVESSGSLGASDEVTESAEITATTEITETSEITASNETTATEAVGSEEADTEATPEAETSEQEGATDEDPTLAGLPEEILAAMAAADPTRGQQLTLSNACIACHNTDPSVVMVGPTWNNVATTAGTRIEGMSTGLYLYNSIVHPNDYVVPTYAAGLMLQIYGALPPQDLADIISYLLTLKEPS